LYESGAMKWIRFTVLRKWLSGGPLRTR